MPREGDDTHKLRGARKDGERRDSRSRSDFGTRQVRDRVQQWPLLKVWVGSVDGRLRTWSRCVHRGF